MSKKGGSGFLDFISSNTEGKKIYNKAISSEKKFLETYKDFLKHKTKYESVYDEHLGNLITLDKLNKMGSSLQTIFETQVFKDDIDGFIDYSLNNPLLLRSYMINSSSKPDDFRREHIKNQIMYQISKLHPNDVKLFKKVTVSMGKNKKIIANFTSFNLDVYKHEISINNNYVLDIYDIKSAVREVVIEIKKKMAINYIQLKEGSVARKDEFLLKNENVGASSFSYNKLSKKLNNLSSTSKTKKYRSAPKPKEIQIPKSEIKEIVPSSISKTSNYYKFRKNIEGEPKDLPKGMNAPLTREQILHFQHQQALPTEEVKDNKGRSIFAVSNIANNIRELLGYEVKGKRSFNKYSIMPIDKLKKIDFSEIKDKDDMDTICQRFSEDEDMCKKIEKCWYNASAKSGNPKCYRFKKKENNN